MSDPLPQWVEAKIDELVTPDYYGKLCLHFKEGRVVLIREERTYIKNSDSDSQDSTGDE